MGKYKDYSYDQGVFLPVLFDKQILPGIFEYWWNSLIEVILSCDAMGLIGGEMFAVGVCRLPSLPRSKDRLRRIYINQYRGHGSGPSPVWSCVFYHT